jgi:hypothetical protein
MVLSSMSSYENPIAKRPKTEPLSSTSPLPFRSRPPGSCCQERGEYGPHHQPLSLVLRPLRALQITTPSRLLVKGQVLMAKIAARHI